MVWVGEEEGANAAGRVWRRVLFTAIAAGGANLERVGGLARSRLADC